MTYATPTLELDLNALHEAYIWKANAAVRNQDGGCIAFLRREYVREGVARLLGLS
jgi:hypothetical protein